MKTTTIQKITNILSETGEVQFSETRESYVLTPEVGKILKNIKTGESVTTKICVSKKALIKNYIEIDDPNTP
jgi:riboflavin synthase alpha subunit